MAVFASASFTGANGTNLDSADANWTKHVNSGTTMTISSNRATTTATAGSDSFYWHETAPSDANYTVTADVYVATANTGHSEAGVTARVSSSATTFYYAFYRIQDTNSLMVLGKFVAGVNTELGTSNITLTNGNTYGIKLEVIGSTIRAYKHGSATPDITVSDSDITDKGYAGIIGFKTNVIPPESFDMEFEAQDASAATLNIDNFSADDEASASFKSWIHYYIGSGSI